MNWHVSNRAHPGARALADRHYNRQSVGADQFVPPGRCLVLVADSALWVTSWPKPEFVHHQWAGAWVCSAFRRESGPVASVLVQEAVAATLWRWPEPPALGMVTFVDPAQVRHKRDPGRCFRKAGFKLVGVTKERKLLAFQLVPADFPEPEAPTGAQGALFG